MVNVEKIISDAKKEVQRTLDKVQRITKAASTGDPDQRLLKFMVLLRNVIDEKPVDGYVCPVCNRLCPANAQSCQNCGRVFIPHGI